MARGAAGGRRSGVGALVQSPGCLCVVGSKPCPWQLRGVRNLCGVCCQSKGSKSRPCHVTEDFLVALAAPGSPPSPCPCLLPSLPKTTQGGVKECILMGENHQTITLLFHVFLRCPSVSLFAAWSFGLGVVCFVVFFLFPSLLCKVGLRIAAGSSVPILDPVIEN